MVDQQCRESEGKAKIEGSMSISDEEAHHCNEPLLQTISDPRNEGSVAYTSMTLWVRHSDAIVASLLQFLSDDGDT